MDNVLKGLFGSGGETGPADKEKARDFVNRYDDGDPTEGYSKDEAVEYFQQASKHASPDQMDRAMKESMNKLNPNQRKEFAEMIQQRAGGGVQRPTADNDGNNVDDLMGGLSQMFGGSGGGIGNILGGLLGGGASANSGTVSDNQGGGGGGLGDILGSSVGKAVLAGAAAFAMKELLDPN